MIPLFKTNMIISISAFILLFIIILIYKGNNKSYPVSEYYYSLEFDGVIVDKYEQPKLHNCFLFTIKEADNEIIEFDFPFIGIDLFNSCNIGDSIRKLAENDSVTVFHNGKGKAFCLEFIRNK